MLADGSPRPPGVAFSCRFRKMEPLDILRGTNHSLTRYIDGMLRCSQSAVLAMTRHMQDTSSGGTNAGSSYSLIAPIAPRAPILRANLMHMFVRQTSSHGHQRSEHGTILSFFYLRQWKVRVLFLPILRSTQLSLIAATGEKINS